MGGFSGEYPRPSVRHMHGQIDENIDPIGFDLLCNLLVALSHRASPYIRVFLNSRGDFVGTAHIGVAVDLKLRVVVMRQ